MKPIVVLVGRPNVGKSTFFNRVTRSRRALVDDLPGVTRDRLYADAKWDDSVFTLVDTGGFAGGVEDEFSRQVHLQLRRAMADADAIVLMLDGRAGVTPFDAEMLDILRAETKPVFFVVNKIDGEEQEGLLYEFHDLGIEHLHPVSAEHGYGIGAFLDVLVEALPRLEAEEAMETIRIAVVGRPNVGKSSLINRLLGEERLLVSGIPGTTRDAVDTFLTRGGKNYCLVDTAGIRKKSKVSRKLEKFSVVRALKSMDRCDVALIMLDAAEGVTEQDIRIAGYAVERGCGCVLLVNKWDLVGADRSGEERRVIDDLRMSARYLGFAPAMTISARTGLRVSKIFRLVDEVFAQYDTRVPTGQLNRILEQALARNEPSLHRGRRIRFYYATQVSTRPPTFVFFVNYPEAVHFSYRRFLVNQIREAAGLDKTPVRVYLRKRTGKGRG
jgi:GTP-binding protein